jgi:hypothetical protein
MNFVLVVDKSGSMREPDKLDWIKESLTIFLKTIREKDFVSLVVFDDTARVLIPAIQLNGAGIRERFQRQIQSITPGGESDIAAGLSMGFREAMSHYSPEYTNRVMLLTDGWGSVKGIVKNVEEYRAQGVEVSMIGYGEKFDAQFAEKLANVGGWSSRFISDRQRMEEVFGTGLARTTVPLARDIRLTVSLKGARVLVTWGYDHRIDSMRNAVRYTLPAIHSSDYETVRLEINLPKNETVGIRTVAVVETSYTDLDGIEHLLEPIGVQLAFGNMSNPVAGYSDARALKAGSMLDYYYSPRLYNTFFGHSR